MTVTFTIPGLRLVNIANARMHWAKRAKLAKQHRMIGRAMTMGHADAWRAGHAVSLVITLTRLGQRNMDSDGLAISCKSLRDGIADALGIDDGDSRLLWVYAQERAPKGMRYGVRVDIRAREVSDVAD